MPSDSNAPVPSAPAANSVTVVPNPIGSMGVGGAAVIVLAWVLSYWHITMTSDVVAALGVIFSASFHRFSSWQSSQTAKK